MPRLITSLVFAVALGAAAPASAQDTDRYLNALVAGWKASFLCSGLFIAGLTEEQVAADDLTRIYPEYRPLIGKFDATIDREARTVSVPWADGMPPRIAAWRPNLGCAQLPIGAGPEGVAGLPRLELAPPPPETTAWPTGDEGAVVKLPKAAQARLDARVAAAFDRKTYGEATETTAVVVVKDGRIVAERYREGFGRDTSQRTWSVAKSITATLVGIAAGKGLLKVEDPASIPEWRSPGDPRARITVADLMHMSSGLYSEARGNRTDAVYFGGTSVTERVTGMPVDTAPNTRFVYANNDTLLLARALRAVIGDDQEFLAFPFTELFWKIGMRHTTPETDWRGDFILSSQVWTTARDLARLGLLHLNDGVWEGERILPAGWVKFVTTPAPVQPAKSGYGAQWWLIGGEGGLPADAYAARGNRGQFVIVVPSERLVVVRRGFDGTGGQEASFDSSTFAADVIAALKR